MTAETPMHRHKMNAPFRGLFVPLLLAVCFWAACENATEPRTRTGSLRGTVRSVPAPDGAVIRSASVTWEDSLLAVSDASGAYAVSSLPEGTYQMTCRASGYRDSTMQVQIEGGKTAVLNFFLAPDLTTGWVFGEFQDLALYEESLKTNPSMRDWNAKTLYDAATGATIQYKTYDHEVAERKVSLGDSVLAEADAWGQYVFKIRTGAYGLTGSCDGFESVTQTVIVEPNGRHYVNFFLPVKN
jgi:hypothetical protein